MSRVISALALIPIVVSIIWFLPLGTVLLAQVILCAAFFEYANLAEKSGSPFPRSISVVAALSTCAAFSLVPSMLHIVLMVSVVSIATIYLVQGQFKQALSAVSASMFAVVYLAVPIGSLVSLRITFGPEVVILLLLSVVASDTAQYYGGRLFGRRSLAAVSPNKTVEGAVFGIAASVIVMWLVGRWWLDDVSVELRLLFGMAIAGFGIAGDLFESSLKRNAHVKDASELIPGHGGVLDRIDGLLFAAPVYYTVIQLIR
jgi:phosphatidate cytidylyltransferase